MNIHYFDSTKEAYAACQCDDAIENGDVLVIVSEGVIGVADTWPVAVTLENGDLHAAKDGVALMLHASERGIEDGVAAARQLAMDLDLPIMS